MTGGNSGVGYETVIALLQKNAKVYIAGRSEQRVTDAIAQMKRDHPDIAQTTPHFMQLDLGDLRSIEAFAQNFMKTVGYVDMLYNSAGVVRPPPGCPEADGPAVIMRINSLGPYYLTKLLLPALREAKKRHKTRAPRVCFTSSTLHRLATSKGFDPQDPSGQRTCYIAKLNAGLQAYANSKVRENQCRLLTPRWPIF